MKNKKMLCKMLLALLLGLVMLIAGCGDEKAENTNADKNTAKKSADGNVITVMYEDDLKPHSYTENNEGKGFIVDILKEAFKRAGLEVKFTTAPWKRVLQMVEDGEADATGSIYKTAEREQKFLFSQENIFIDEVVFAVKKGSKITFNGDLNTMTGYSIGSLAGYPPLTQNEEVQKKLKIETVENNSQMIEKLSLGRVDLIVNDKITLALSLKEAGKTNEIDFLSPSISSEPCFVAYTKKKDMKAIADKIDKYLAEMKADGTMQKIVDKYIK